MAESGAGTGYGITPDSTTANEGDTVTFDITAPDDADLYYQITGDITADDIASGTLTGTITITAGVGSLAVELLEDGTLEGSEEFAVELYTDSGLTELVATSATVTVADTSTAKVYSIAHDATPAVVSEGAVVTYTLTTEGVVDGSRLWWRCKDTGETETVVVENAAEVEHYTGTITATGASTLSDSAATWTVDQWAGESVETAGETLVIVSNTTDTLTLAAPWAVAPTGGYRIITPADTTEYSAGSSISSQDTVEGETSFLSEGPIEIVGGTGTFTLTLRSDLITEGSEYIILDIYDEPGSPFGDGEPVATSEPVIVLDTSTSADYVWTGTTFVFGTPVVGETGYASEGATVSVIITASPPPPDGTRLRMQVLGTVDGSDYTITGGSG